MPKAQGFDVEVIKTLSETEIKKESETTSTEVWKPATGKRFRLAGFTVFSSAETAVTLEDETTAFFIFGVAAKTAVTISLASLPTCGYLSVTPGNKLKLKTLNTAKFTGSFYGIEDTV